MLNLDKKDNDDVPKLIKKIDTEICSEPIKIYSVPSALKPNKIAWADLIANRPKERSIGYMYGREFEFSSLIRIFNDDYWFSGKLHKQENKQYKPEPMLVDLLNYTKQYMNDNRFNGLMAQYYMSGNDKLPRHNDSKKGIIYNTPTIWYWYGSYRSLRVYQNHSIKLHTIDLDDGTMIIFPKEMQRYYQHEIPESSSGDALSVCISIRAFE